MIGSKVTDYAVAGGYSQSELQENVNKHLQQGWKPQGGVFVLLLNPGELPERMIFWQALIKESI